MNEKRVNTHKIEGHAGAMVWELKDDLGMFYLTNSRGGHRSTRKLESTTMDEAVKEAKDALA